MVSEGGAGGGFSSICDAIISQIPEVCFSTHFLKYGTSTRHLRLCFFFFFIPGRSVIEAYDVMRNYHVIFASHQTIISYTVLGK